MKIKSLVTSTETFLSMQAIKSANGDDKQHFEFFGVNRYGQFRVKVFGTKFLVDGAIYICKALLHKSNLRRLTPTPSRGYATAAV